MKAVFLIIRELVIDDITYTDVLDECYSNLPSAELARGELDDINYEGFIYLIKAINLIN